MSRPFAYYNENDAFASAWLRELIKAKVIMDGYVDSRSIEDVTPDDLDDFTRCHFFAGIGGWDYALQLAGWPDYRPIWTGSCPCQPFSTAGKGGGFADERHLWPAWFWLIQQYRPDIVIGEQVEAAIAHGWLDLVQDDMEGADYAFAAVGLPAASVGTAHIRHRLYWLADTNGARRREGRASEAGDGRESAWQQLTGLCDASRANTNSKGFSVCGSLATGENRKQGGRALIASGDLHISGAADADRAGVLASVQRPTLRWLAENRAEVVGGSPIGGHWRDAEWLRCADNKVRPVESGTFPLAHGVPARVGRLRGYGNAIVPQVAAEVLKAYLGSVR